MALPTPPQAANILHRYKLDEASGTRADSVGALDLTDNNTVGSVAGNFGVNAAQFVEANGEYLSGVDDPDFDIVSANNRTISVWHKDDGDTASSQAIAGKWNVSARNWLLMRQNDGKARFFTGNGGAGTVGNIISTSNINDGLWHHIAVSYAAGTAKLFIDGTEEASGAIAATASTAGFSIGAQDATGGVGSATLANSSMNDFIVWDLVLTPTEINDIATSTGGSTFTPSFYFVS